jgi:hypothetical protein
LDFPLLGRPRRSQTDSFATTVQCYWAKFPFNTVISLRLHIATDYTEALEYIAQRYTFVGPAPRYLYSTLMGNVKSSLFQGLSLSALRTVQSAVFEKFGIRHHLYTLQKNPCDLCHFAGAVYGKKDDADFRLHVRGGGESKSRHQWLMHMALENRMIRISLSFLAPLSGGMRHFADKWADLTTAQKVFLARAFDISEGLDFQKLKQQMRAIKNSRFAWMHDRADVRLVRVLDL